MQVVNGEYVFDMREFINVLRRIGEMIGKYKNVR